MYRHVRFASQFIPYIYLNQLIQLKEILREELIEKRLAMTIHEQQKLSKQIVAHIQSHSLFSSSATIAIYLPFKNEVDLSSLFRTNKTLLLPVVHEDLSMHFAKYKLGDEVKMNRFKIMEPKYNNIYPANQIDLCLLPLVGFNRNGGRIGMGAGFYDRFFAINHMMKKPTVLAGVAYDTQEDPRIENDYWDIPLDYIFTNKEVIET